MDSSWRLDRSDGINRSLNLTEIEERRPSAPPVYPILPYNPFFSNSPLPFSDNLPTRVNNELTMNELRKLEMQEEREDWAKYLNL